MTSNNRLGMALAGAVIALSAAACAGNDGTGNGSEAVGEQAQNVSVRPLAPDPIPVSGPNTGCNGSIKCTSPAGYPSLVLSCPETASWTQAGSTTYGTTFQEFVTNAIPTYPVQACVSGGSGGLFSCDEFSTYMASATNTYCGVQTQPNTCNGVPKPRSGCNVAWTCCGDDGWECGRCR
jgi:hypothetical protein